MSPERLSRPAFAVLLVCTGNQCRSPAAEALFRRELSDSPCPFEFFSTGTRAADGFPLHPLTGRALAARGIEPPEHVSQRITPDIVRLADLVLTAERVHRTVVVELDPSATRRTFTVKEFARLALSLPEPPAVLEAGPAEVVSAIAGLRGRVPGSPDDDLDDPIRGDQAMHDRVVDQLVTAVERCGDALVRGCSS